MGHINIVDALRQLKPTGPDGFEGLITKLLSSLTGLNFRLARSGSQMGRDMHAREPSTNVVAVECKRYGQPTELNERELLGELVQVQRDIPDTDIWVLVASREVDSQLFEHLWQEAEKKGIAFVCIAPGDGEPNSLEALCAHAPNITTGYLVSQLSSNELSDLSEALSAIAQSPGFLTAIEDLRRQLLSPHVGIASWRASQHNWFRSRLQSQDASHAAFKQLLNVAEPATKFVERQTLNAALDRWFTEWDTKRLPFVTLGDEGDGKTWGVASWLNRKIAADPSFPPVLFIASSAANSNDPQELTVTTSATQTGVHSTANWHRRLDRWLTHPTTSTPALILVLDGINERRSFAWWQELLAALKGERYANVAILMTCRTEYWQRTLGRLETTKVEGYVLPCFSPEELQQALDLNSVRRSDIHPSLLELIGKPRYLDLTIRYQDRLEQSGDPTPARLIYEDWRDRISRKPNADVAITDEEFRNLLRDLADKHYFGGKIIKNAELQTILASHPERQLLLDELRSSGVLSGVEGRYKVVDRQLAFGFGLLLVDKLLDCFEEDPEADLLEAAARWLEPAAAMDLKARICEMAALHALEIGQVAIQIKLTLLKLWLNSQNPSVDTEGTLVDYLPIDPVCYVRLAELIWGEGEGNYWAQDLLKHAFIYWYRRSPKVESILTSAFEYWLRYVHVQGYPSQRRSKSERSEAVRSEICVRVGRELKPGVFTFAGRDFTAIDSDGLLYLADAALAVISHVPLEPFIPMIATACLAEAIMGRPEKYELLQWLFSTAQSSVWSSVKRKVQKLLEFESTTTAQAAYRLLTFEGSRQAYELRQTLPPDLFPSNPIMLEIAKDPCASGFSWHRSICEDCLLREDLPAHFIARQIKSHSVDPALKVPPDFGTRLAPLTQAISADHVWTTMAPGEDQHNLETFEPALCAYAPDAIAELIRTIVRQAPARQGLALRQLACQTREHELLFEQNDLHALYQAWLSLSQSTESWSEEQETAEMFLFEIVLPYLEPQAQIERLLQRPETAWDLIRYAVRFLPVQEWPALEHQLQQTTNSTSLRRILWFIAAHPDTIPAEFLREYIVPLLENDDSAVRAATLRLIQKADNAEVAHLATPFWSWQPTNDDNENHWGNLLLCEHGHSLTISELSQRIEPIFLGYAVHCRGLVTAEIEFLAEQMHNAWSKLKSPSMPAVPDGFPQISIDVDEDADRIKERNLIDLMNDDSSREITLQNRYRSSGTSKKQALFDWQRPLQEQIEERQSQDRQTVSGIIQHQVQEGNHWFARHFPQHTLAKIVTHRPDLLEQWLDALAKDDETANRLLRSAHSFYESLCIVLLQHSPEQGLTLYTKLAGSPIVSIDSSSGLRLLDRTLFSLSSSGDVIKLWLAKLKGCKTDLELLTITTVAHSGAAREWLWTVIDHDCDSESPRDKSLAITMLGFFDGEIALQRLNALAETTPDTWQGKLIQTSLERWQRNHWAQHWFRRFFAAERTVDAWAAFRLFLACVDRRFWNWRTQIQTEYTHHPDYQRRKQFMTSNLETIRNRSRKNEDTLKKHLYGQKVIDNQVWPWM